MFDHNKEFRKILKNNFQSLRKELHPLKTECMRVYDRNMPDVPATVELYDKYAKIDVQGKSVLSNEQIMSAAAAMLYISKDHIVLQERKQHRRDMQQHAEVKKTIAPEGKSLTVLESGLKFTVELGTRADTGLFLDHLPTRMMVRDSAMGCNVLNLFSYTGSFSVYSAAGGANQVVSVDLSNTYSRWAEQNLLQNGFFGTKFPCIRADVYRFLHEQAEEYGPFDLAVCDPPTFSNSNKMSGIFDVQRDYINYLQKLLEHIVPGGAVIFSTNFKGFHFDSGRLPEAECKNITKQTIAPGFARKRPPHTCYLLYKR